MRPWKAAITATVAAIAACCTIGLGTINCISCTVFAGAVTSILLDKIESMHK